MDVRMNVWRRKKNYIQWIKLKKKRKRKTPSKQINKFYFINLNNKICENKLYLIIVEIDKNQTKKKELADGLNFCVVFLSCSEKKPNNINNNKGWYGKTNTFIYIIILLWNCFHKIILSIVIMIIVLSHWRWDISDRHKMYNQRYILTKISITISLKFVRVDWNVVKLIIVKNRCYKTGSSEQHGSGRKLWWNP